MLINSLPRLKEIALNAFSHTLNLAANLGFEENQIKSAKFLYEFSAGIHREWFSDYHFNIQNVDDYGKKSSGEWLFDMCITRQEEMKINKYSNTGNKLNVEILLALECEFHTGSPNISIDFGKLLCSNAKQCVYIQGISQKTDNGRIDFIKERKSVIEKILANFSQDFYILFVPSPEKKHNQQSFWFTGLPLIDYIEVYHFNPATKTLQDN